LQKNTLKVHRKVRFENALFLNYFYILFSILKILVHIKEKAMGKVKKYKKNLVWVSGL